MRSNKYSPNNPHSNPSYEPDEYENVNIGRFQMSGGDLSGDDDISQIIDDFDSRQDIDSRMVRTPTGNELHSGLEGIQEEEDARNTLSVPGAGEDHNKKISFGLDNMSLSNFKNLSSSEENPSSSEFKREPSIGSAINMKDVSNHGHSSSAVVQPPHHHHQNSNYHHSDVGCGLKFRKTSTFVITPKLSIGLGPTNDCSVCCDDLDIKFVDTPYIPELFIEFDALVHSPITDSYIWIEKSRWLRYEEDYDQEIERFDNPHLSPMSMRGLSDFKNIFKQGQVILDCQNTNYVEVLQTLCDATMKCPKVSPMELTEIRQALVTRHVHGTKKRSHLSLMNIEYGMHGKTSRARLDDCLDPGTEALSIQVGAIETLTHIYSLFVRLDPPIYAEGINEVNCPMRFIYTLLGPKTMEQRLYEIGRCFAVMMSNKNFREEVYSAVKSDDIIGATNTFLQHSVVVPLPKVITTESVTSMIVKLKSYQHYFKELDNRKTYEQFRLELEKKPDQSFVVNQESNGQVRKMSIIPSSLNVGNLSGQGGIQLPALPPIQPPKYSVNAKEISCFTQFIPPFYQLFCDLKGLPSRYASDFTDAFMKENISTVFIGMIFIYFVVLSPAITFGALMSKLISPKMGVSLCLVSGGTFMFIYMLVTGQPLEIVGITGPLFVVEKVLALLASSSNIQLEIMRFWIGIYVSILGFVFVFFNGSIVIKHFRRSVEEVFNFFVGAIFILSALFNMFKALPYSQVSINGTVIALANDRLKFGWGGTTLFLAFLMVNFCLILVQIKRGSFFRRQIRNLLGSFNVPLGILLVFVLERIFFFAYEMPTLAVPPSDQVNITLWSNPPPFDLLTSATSAHHGFCFLIALSVFSIMITEISTNSISVTKAERKLVKPSLYSLNYFFILVVFPLISAFLGWPYVSGAMVRSNAHIIAMSKWSLNNLPGVPPKVTGAVEQRVSGLFVGTLVFLSVFLGSILRYIPLAAMYGMFLYMGVMGVRDLVVTQRILSLLQRRKYWNISTDFLKDFPAWKIGVLVLSQLFFISILIILQVLSDFTIYSWTILIFPLFVGMYAMIRGYILPLWPQLNLHLSKMDKKHVVKLYSERMSEDKNKEQFVVVMDNSGLDVHVESTNIIEQDEEDGSCCGHDDDPAMDLH